MSRRDGVKVAMQIRKQAAKEGPQEPPGEATLAAAQDTLM